MFFEITSTESISDGSFSDQEAFNKSMGLCNPNLSSNAYDTSRKANTAITFRFNSQNSEEEFEKDKEKERPRLNIRKVKRSKSITRRRCEADGSGRPERKVIYYKEDSKITWNNIYKKDEF